MSEIKKRYLFEKNGVKTFGFEYLFLTKSDLIRTIVIGTFVFVLVVFFSKVWILSPALTIVFYLVGLLFPIYGYLAGESGDLTIALSEESLGCAVQYSTSYASRVFFRLSLETPIEMIFYEKRRELAFLQNGLVEGRIKLPRNLHKDSFNEGLEDLSVEFNLPLKRVKD